VEAKSGEEVGPFILNDDKPLQYIRFYFDKPCYGIHVQLITDYGLAMMNAGPRMDVPLYTWVSNFPHFRICPRDFISRLGTYAIRSEGFLSPAVKFKVKVTFFDPGSYELPLSNTTTLCPGGAFGATCLENEKINGPYHLSALQFFITKIRVTTCQQFVLFYEVPWAKENRLGLLGFLYSTDVPGFTPANYFIGTAIPHVFSVCPKPSQNFTDLFITVVNTEVEFEVMISFQ